MAEQILVFPAGLPEAEAFAAMATAAGNQVVGASSLRDDPMRAHYARWIWLPYVHDGAFDAALAAALADQQITTVFTSHEVVRHRLSVLLPHVAPGVSLIDRAQPARAASIYRDIQAFAAACGADVEALARQVEVDAVIGRALAMRGESSSGKLGCLFALAPLLPRGDVVEIGALSGRSASVLGWLARRHGVGPVLVIDPWTQEAALQHDAPETLREGTRALDFEVFLHEFLENLIPAFYGTLNYLRESASRVRPRYRADFAVMSAEFGLTRYKGRISLLHIDGNHDYSAVSRDVADWAPLVCSGGWTVIDDYVWSFGDGPRRAADELLAAGGWARAFVCDGALFMQADRSK